MARDSFEIYHFQSGRWSLHAGFEGNQRDLALAEAQELEKTMGGAPIRLVRETFNPETNTSESVVAWQSAKAKQMPDSDNMFGDKAAAAPAPKKTKPKKAPPPRREEPRVPPPAPAAKTTNAPPKVKKKKKKKKPGRGVLAKLAIVVSMSLLLSVIATGISIGMIQGLEYFKAIANADRSGLVAAIFLISYVVSALYQLVRQFDLWREWRERRKAAAAVKATAASAGDMLKRMRQAGAEADAYAGTTDDVGGMPAADIPIEELRAQIEQSDAEAEAQADANSNLDEGFGEAETVTETAPGVGEPPAPATESGPGPAAAEAPRAPEPPSQAAPAPLPPEPPKVEKPPEPEKPSPEAEARNAFLAFVRAATGTAAAAQPQMNAFLRFGFNLYVAGACATFGQSRKLGRTPQLTILRDGLQSAGTSRERAENFCAELPSYGKNPRYAGMVQAGGEAMNCHLSGKSDPTADLTNLLNDWGRPEKRSTVPTEITFLFTDLVGSTAMTSQLGNAGAQRVVRAHNTAVRAAIQAHQGREVKHTGDGIMATFPTPAAAVQAAIRMQKELVATSNANPALNFSVRMGINVGEAVEEDNDFFGGAVQMTARVCAAASERNIWVSKAIVDACRGQRIGFIPRGAFQMKGIQQARPLYEVAYTDAHRNELSNL